eukprot:973533-Rhodomonas_salina.1
MSSDTDAHMRPAADTVGRAICARPQHTRAAADPHSLCRCRRVPRARAPRSCSMSSGRGQAAPPLDS